MGEGSLTKYNREYSRKMRRAVLTYLGNKCGKCGFSDYRALQVDHIKGGGQKERNNFGSLASATQSRKILKSLMANENKFQLLCSNCNWIKRYENNESKNGHSFHNGDNNSEK